MGEMRGKNKGMGKLVGLRGMRGRDGRDGKDGRQGAPGKTDGPSATGHFLLAAHSMELWAAAGRPDPPPGDGSSADHRVGERLLGLYMGSGHVCFNFTYN